MAMSKWSSVFKQSALAAGLTMVMPLVPIAYADAMVQASASAPAAAGRQLGTVKAVAGNTLTLTTDAGQEVVVSVADGVRVLQLAPGSTDLKTAQTITLADIATGDRVLV